MNVSARAVADTLTRIVRQCPTCGEPVMWMAQHRECWQWEKAEAAKAGTTVEKLFCWVRFGSGQRAPIYPARAKSAAA